MKDTISAEIGDEFIFVVEAQGFGRVVHRLLYIDFI